MRDKKILVPVSIVIIIILTLVICCFYFNDELISTNSKDIEFSDNDFNRVLVHDFKSGYSVESSLKITKAPIYDSSDYNIVVTFNNYRNNDAYEIENLEINIKPNSDVTLQSVYFDDGVSSKSVFQFSNNIFNAKSKSDYLHLNIIVSNYYSDSIEFDIGYDIYGCGLYSINKYKELGTCIFI